MLSSKLTCEIDIRLLCIVYHRRDVFQITALPFLQF